MKGKIPILERPITRRRLKRIQEEVLHNLATLKDQGVHFIYDKIALNQGPFKCQNSPSQSVSKLVARMTNISIDKAMARMTYFVESYEVLGSELVGEEWGVPIYIGKGKRGVKDIRGIGGRNDMRGMIREKRTGGMN
ncbi:hypothetical protein CR513_32877, partial [Mucuna pruriens]